MSHCIERPIDEVRTTSGNSEWHGLAEAPLASDNGIIGENTVRRLCPNIREMRVSGEIDGVTITLPHHKALVADYREVRPELVSDDGSLSEHAFVPLHIPKNRYEVISNAQLWEVLKKSIENTNAKVVTAGTLGAGRRCFFSVDIAGESDIEVRRVINSSATIDKIHAFLNIVTSHDGSLGATGYDSTVRIVCQNTLNASLEAAGEVGFCVYHTSGATVAMQNMGELLNAILTGRAKFKDTMTYLDGIAIDHKAAEEIAAGYFVMFYSQGEDKANYELTGRTLNAVDEIVTLYVSGRGNHGKTAYDLLNGATDYWTNGNGTGKKATKWEKMSKANYGEAAQHKVRFCNLLVGNIDEVREIGRKALSIARTK